MMSAVYLKDLGASNEVIGLTSILQLPWTLKFIWAPLVDFLGLKKTWIVVAQFILVALIALLAASVLAPDPLKMGIVVLGLIALVSSTHDNAIDGYYLEVLNKAQQALFVGVVNTSYRMAMIFGTGALITLAGVLTPSLGKLNAWSCSFAILSFVLLSLFALHKWYLPDTLRAHKAEREQDAVSKLAVSKLEKALAVQDQTLVGAVNAPGKRESHLDKNPFSGRTDSSKRSPHNHLLDNNALSDEYLPLSKTNDFPDADSEDCSSTPRESLCFRSYLSAISSYFSQPGAIAIVVYILLFRMGDAMAMKMIPPFLQDPISKGGLGLSVEKVGTIYGTVGVCFLLIGGIAGGYLVSRFGLRKLFWPTTLVMNSTILGYFLLASLHPSGAWWIYVVNSLEQFGYGFGMASYTVFMLSTVKQEYKAAHYAVATALMALGILGPSMISGFAYKEFGYANFFLLSFLLTIPGMVSLCFLPVWEKQTGSAGVHRA